MRANVIRVLLVSASICATLAGAAHAGTVEAKFATGYDGKDDALHLADGPVVQPDISWSKGAISGVHWFSYGKAQFAKEIDPAMIFYNKKVGPVELQASLQIYMLNGPKGVFNPHNWTTEEFIQGYVPLKVGPNLTIGPTLKHIEMQGFGFVPNHRITQMGAKVVYQANDRLRGSLDFRHSIDSMAYDTLENGNPLTIHGYTSQRWDAAASYKLTAKTNVVFCLEGFHRNDTYAPMKKSWVGSVTLAYAF
jgi:hypothetical protein